MIYKTSYDKANRTSLERETRAWAGRRTADLQGNPRRLWACRSSPTCTSRAALRRRRRRPSSVLQIPAFLCRQTDLLLAAGDTGIAHQHQKRPVPGPLGYEKRRRQGRKHRQHERHRDRAWRQLWLQHPGDRFPRPADHGQRDRLPGRLRCHPFRPAAGRAGRIQPADEREFAPVLGTLLPCRLGIAAVFMETHQDPDTAPRLTGQT